MGEKTGEGIMLEVNRSWSVNGVTNDKYLPVYKTGSEGVPRRRDQPGLTRNGSQMYPVHYTSDERVSWEPWSTERQDSSEDWEEGIGSRVRTRRELLVPVLSTTILPPYFLFGDSRVPLTVHLPVCPPGLFLALGALPQVPGVREILGVTEI